MLPCQEGTFQNKKGATFCILASPGHYVPTNTSPVELICPIGEFQNMPGSTGCIASKQGFYVESDERVSQLPCPSGTYSPIGGIDRSGCILSSPGNYSVSGSTLQNKCEKGHYQPIYGQSSCLESDPGYFVTEVGMAKQEYCPGGTYQPNYSSTYCLLSPKDTFSPPGSTEPTECPFDGISLTEGSKYWSDCFIDSDGDGVDDYEDAFPNSANLNQSNSLYFALAAGNLIAISLIPKIDRREQSGD